MQNNSKNGLKVFVNKNITRPAGTVCGGRCPYQDTASGGNRSI